MSEYVNSRGMFEEQLRGITEALHQEVHLMEAMQKEPSKVEDMTPYLDLIRKNRQEMVKTTFPENVNPNHWCLLKHSLLKVRHLEEVMQGAARENPKLVPRINEQIRLAIEERDKALGLFTHPISLKGKCARCYDDLLIINEDSPNEYSNEYQKVGQSLNSINSNNSYINVPIRESKEIILEGDENMYKEVGLIGLGQVAEKLVERGIDYVPFETVQLYKKTTKVVVGVALVLAANMKQTARYLGSTGKMVANVAGAGLIVNAGNEYVDELMAVPTTVTASLRSRQIVSRNLTGSALRGRQFGQIPEAVRDEPALF